MNKAPRYQKPEAKPMLKQLAEEDYRVSDEQVVIAEHLVQIFQILCRLCNVVNWSPLVAGDGADYNDRFDAARHFYEQGWRTITEGKRVVCPKCFKTIETVKKGAAK